MYKKLIVPGCVLLIIIITFAWAWLDTYNKTKWIYEEAMQHYTDGNYVWAIKGDHISKERNKVYYYGVGLQHVIEKWERVPMFLRPGLYKKADGIIKDLIENKMTKQALKDMCDWFEKIDPRYLPEAKIRIGDILYNEGDYKGALDMYVLVKKQHGTNPDICSIIESRIDKANNSSSN